MINHDDQGLHIHTISVSEDRAPIRYGITGQFIIVLIAFSFVILENKFLLLVLIGRKNEIIIIIN